MKQFKAMIATLIAVAGLLIFGFTYRNDASRNSLKHAAIEKGCVFRTVMGEESSIGFEKYKSDEGLTEATQRGLEWIVKAQNRNGGWGAGSHARQHIIDPHAVSTDPATTAMVSMALLRSGNTLLSGDQRESLRKGLEYLLDAVEKSSSESTTITNERGTQIQMKLGENIDVILTAQFLSNMLEHVEHDLELKARLKRAVQTCINKIQSAQQNDGSIAGAGWAGVLQSAFAISALESAQANGIEVDSAALQRGRDHQRGNYNAVTGETKTDMGAGVVLYSITGSVRGTAKQARKVKEDVAKAKKEGKIGKDRPVTTATLNEIGYSDEEALQSATAYEVYESAKVKAQQNDVMDGFGSNGGEEFLSYLQTGESMIINKDETWQKWFDNISGRLLRIQNQNGSWNGHHCITSPVFCTATCLLILSINNDVDKLTGIGRG